MEKFTLIKDRHILCKGNDNVLQNENGDWLVLDLIDNKMFYLTPTLEIMKFFNIKVDNEPEKESERESEKEFVEQCNTNTEDENKENSGPKFGKWERSAILCLIELFKNNYDKFKSTSIKNEHVWFAIKEEMNKKGFKYTKIQVENKFKYLKQRYIKKKDNMSNKSTGQSPITFDYFLEFDEIFGSKPSVKPLAIASSSKLEINVCDDSTDENEEPEKKKIKVSRYDKAINGWREFFSQQDEEKEKTRERRHRERMELTEKALSTYEKLMAKLIDKM